MPQLSLLRGPQPMEWSFRVWVPFDPDRPFKLAAAASDFDGKPMSSWHHALGKDVEAHDVGRIMVAAYECFLYGDSWALAETCDRVHRELVRDSRPHRGGA